VDACDVAIVGGGPAGSACAWRLRRAGLDVVVVDRATFPRDKVCAGWITPQVLDDLRIDPEEYREGRILQPVTGFRVGVIGSDRTIETSYDHPVSFGVRRCEFDTYLLRRSGARLLLGTPLSSIRRDGGRWVLNETIRASMLVGAGGHFCPVARMLNGPSEPAPLVVAREAEFALAARDASAFRTGAEQPELYFCRDLMGYGWCFRKGNYFNVGFGCTRRHEVPRATAEFVTFLAARRRIPATVSCRWRGHAYLLSGSLRRRAVDESVVLIGDAAGLAYPQSGEGIRPAVESGLMAASTIIHANGGYARDRLEPYEKRLRERFGVHAVASLLSSTVHAMAPPPLVSRLLGTPWFVRRVVLDRWFLRAQEPPIAACLKV
jgi:geranylgeranyl reductase family protein